MTTACASAATGCLFDDTEELKIIAIQEVRKRDERTY